MFTQEFISSGVGHVKVYYLFVPTIIKCDVNVFFEKLSNWVFLFISDQKWLLAKSAKVLNPRIG